MPPSVGVFGGGTPKNPFRGFYGLRSPPFAPAPPGGRRAGRGGEKFFLFGGGVGAVENWRRRQATEAVFPTLCSLTVVGPKWTKWTKVDTCEKKKNYPLINSKITKKIKNGIHMIRE